VHAWWQEVGCGRNGEQEIGCGRAISQQTSAATIDGGTKTTATRASAASTPSRGGSMTAPTVIASAVTASAAPNGTSQLVLHHTSATAQQRSPVPIASQMASP